MGKNKNTEYYHFSNGGAERLLGDEFKCESCETNYPPIIHPSPSHKDTAYLVMIACFSSMVLPLTKLHLGIIVGLITVVIILGVMMARKRTLAHWSKQGVPKPKHGHMVIECAKCGHLKAEPVFKDPLM